MELNQIFQLFEQNATAKSREQNLPYLQGTPVAATIDRVPEKLYQDSYYKESQASYSWEDTTKIEEFMYGSNGLLYNGVLVGNFYYEIVKVAILLAGNSDDSYSGYSVQVKVHVFQNGRETVHTLKNISKTQLESPELLLKIPYAIGNSKIAKGDLKNILYSYANYLLVNYTGTTEYVTRSTGWIAFKGKKVYVDAEKALGYPEFLIRAGRGLCIRNAKSVDNLWGEYQNMRHVLRDTSQMDGLLLFVLNSFSFSLFQEAGKTIKHCMFLAGERGSRKTALALCFSQLENKESPEFNFLASESGIQSHFQDYHDSCLLIDDLAPSINATKRKTSEQKLEMIIRLFGDAGKRVINTYFSSVSAENLDYSVKGGAIITGEYFYSAGVESSIARTIVLEIEKNSVDLERLTYFQQHPEILETLIYRFLVFISKHWDESKKVIKNVVEHSRKKYQNVFSNGRYADYIGQYIAMSYFLRAFFQEESGISGVQGDTLCAEIENNMVRLLTVNDCKMKNRAPINTLLLGIVYMTEIGRTVAWGSDLPMEEVCLVETEIAFYVRQKDLPDIIKMYCTKTGEPYVKMTSQELGKLLKQEGICTVYHEGEEERLAKKYTKDYGNIRLMELSKQMIADRIGILIQK